MCDITNAGLTARLRTLRAQSRCSGIRRAVICEALRADDALSFFAALRSGGCVSGAVSRLIYRYDTWDFFVEHYREIDALRRDWEDATGSAIQLDGDLANDLVWFAFEFVADDLYCELGADALDTQCKYGTM